MRRPLLVLLLLAAPLAHASRRRAPAPPDMAEVAATLRERALATDEPWRELEELCDGIGHRLAGSPALERAVRWAARHLAADGLEVALEPVEVPRWVRGHEAGRILAPLEDDLALLGLGGTVATPEGGLEAPVLVVGSYDELTARAAEAAGRVVLFDVPFTTYGETVGYRYGAASAAARVGAVAALVRSITPTSLYTPHTGGQRYADDAPRIPVAAVTIEDAARLRRWQSAGVTPRVRLELSGRDAGTAPSHNVVGTLRGREAPEEVVVLACHLDSWDVGQGAQDDGAGCVTVMEAAAQLAALPVRPRRTVRVVLYTNEEHGLTGGRAFAEAHAGERIVAAVEDDTGAGVPLGWRLDVRTGGKADAEATAAVAATLAPYAPWLAPLGADRFTPGFAGADVTPLVERGTVGIGLDHDMTGYWPVHHTEADTLDKIDPEAVKRNVAAMTVLAWVLAEHPGALRPEPPVAERAP